MAAASPDGKSLLCRQHAGNSVSQFSDRPSQRRAFAEEPGNRSLQAGDPGDIAVTPDGKSAYVTQWVHRSATTVSQYDIDPVTGALSPKNPADRSGWQRSRCEMAITARRQERIRHQPVWRGNVSQYSIDPATGALSPKNPATVAGLC